MVKFIGYDAGESYRSDKVLLGDLADPKYSKWYPLMEWGWDRAACLQAIEDAGLPQPGKSSCFFCPSMRAEEIIYLRDHHPDLFRRAIALEDNARPQFENDGPGPGPELLMERTIWKGVLRTWQLLRRSAATLKRPGRRSPSSRKRLRALEAQLTEEENLEIVRMVKAVKMDNRELTAFLKAYASGLITLPDGMMEAEAAADPRRRKYGGHRK